VEQDTKHLRAFGATAYAHIPKEKRTSKFAPRAYTGIMIGYSLQSKGWRVYLPGQRTILETGDCIFDESTIANKTKLTPVQAQVQVQAQEQEAPTDWALELTPIQLSLPSSGTHPTPAPNTPAPAPAPTPAPTPAPQPPQPTPQPTPAPPQSATPPANPQTAAPPARRTSNRDRKPNAAIYGEDYVVPDRLRATVAALLQTLWNLLPTTQPSQALKLTKGTKQWIQQSLNC
jgi:outer membrane biosynthesis protein TonB